MRKRKQFQSARIAENRFSSQRSRAVARLRRRNCALPLDQSAPTGGRGASWPATTATMNLQANNRNNVHLPRINGLALFATVVTIILLGVTIGGNIAFDRLLVAQQQRQTEPSAAAPATVPVSATANTMVAAHPQSQTRGAEFAPPDKSELPDGEYGKAIRLGEKIFMETGRYAPQYVGNHLSCANCHLDAGRRPNSSPLWAAFVHYPAFRSKTGKVDTLAARIQDCFRFSMNGKAPPLNGDVLTALQTYAFWLAKGAPVGTPLQGSGYPKLNKPALPPDYARGEKVYAQHCALCHGADGRGLRAEGRQVFPPLWGRQSFNWGAGMHQIANAAGFIHANMPLGKGGSLSEQDAWDVALYMNSHERPQDPRFTVSVATTRKKYHDSDDSTYGRNIGGHVLGSR